MHSVNRILKSVIAPIMLLTSSFVLGQQKVIFKDDFKNNKRDWMARNDSNFLVKVDQGLLHLEKFQRNREHNGCLWYSKKITRFNTAKDFSITFYAKVYDGGEAICSFDFQWGYWENDEPGSKKKIYQLNFLGDRVRIDEFDTDLQKRWKNGETKYVKDSLKAIVFDPFVFNKYEILQQGYSISFKINDVVFYNSAFTAIEGNGIGFLQCLKSAWDIDKIIIRGSRK